MTIKCAALPFKETLETAISVFWYSTNLKMPNNFSLAQTVNLRSGISVSGLAVRESEVSSQSCSLGRRGKQTKRKKGKIVQLRPKVLNIRLFWAHVLFVVNNENRAHKSPSVTCVKWSRNINTVQPFWREWHAFVRFYVIWW